MKNKNNKGFTLIELVVVIAILAVLALILIPSITGYVKKADDARLAATARSIHTAATLIDSEDPHAVSQEITVEKGKEPTYAPAKKLYDMVGDVDHNYKLAKDAKGNISVTILGTDPEVVYP